MTISILEGSDSDIEIGIDFLRSNLLNWKSSYVSANDTFFLEFGTNDSFNHNMCVGIHFIFLRLRPYGIPHLFDH